MLFKNEVLRASTAITTLMSLSWIVSGGEAWAETRVARRDPVWAISRLARDPRVGLSSEAREYLESQIAVATTVPEQAVPAREPAACTQTKTELAQVADELDRLAAGASAKSAAFGTRLEAAEKRLRSADESTMRDFAAVGAMLRAAELPTEIQMRQVAAVEQYRREMDGVLRRLAQAGREADPGARSADLRQLASRLALSHNERPLQRFDPATLPFRAAAPTLAKMANKTEEAPPRLASRIAAKASPPSAGDLAANEDVEITPEIRALAASLNNSPVEIYHWVRNHIAFVPTYGSVQGSALTLLSKRGNAFDTTSLLLALLRAAGIPSRYVTGTIEVPAEQAMNWVGGAESPAVAQQLLGQGGVPTVGLVSAGQVVALRVDHVWVEALVDFIPSRGAAAGPPDTWVALDASFKQHVFTPRSGVFADNPFSAVVDPAEHLFDFDPALGRITNVDSQPLQDRLAEWVGRSDAYLIAHHGPGVSLADLLASKQVVAEQGKVLPASLPYRVLNRGSAVSLLPASLRHSVALAGFASDFDRALGNKAFDVRLSLPTVNSKRLGLQFDPATAADAATLEAARSSGASSLPVYLIHVVPVIRLDGVEVGRGTAVQMGAQYAVDVTLRGPEGPTTIPFRIVAGDEVVVGVTGNGVTQEVVERRFAEHPVADPQEYFHQVQLHYWMESDNLGEAAAGGRGVHLLRLPSVGFFSSPMAVAYLFGVPRSGNFQGRAMDVRQSLLGVAGTDPTKVVEVMKQVGMQASFLEGSVFDQLKDRANPAVRGLSAVHLLHWSMELGIPLFRITAANSAQVLPLLQLSSAVKRDIATAASQGKTILAAERELNLSSWRGTGYIIQDETTGAGAYLISGGAAGGGLLDCLKKLVPDWETVFAFLLFLLLILLIIAAIFTAPVWEPAFAAIALILLLVGGLGGLNGNPPVA